MDGQRVEGRGACGREAAGRGESSFVQAQHLSVRFLRVHVPLHPPWHLFHPKAT